MFTGSTRTGRRSDPRRERLIPCALELGGKDAMIVLDDANVDRAVGGAVERLFNAGQSCISVERVYVQEGVYDEFVGKLTEKVNGMRVGMDAMDSWEAGTARWPTTTQMGIVERHVQDAVDKGARAITGGQRGRTALLPADRARRRRPHDGVHDRGDVRPDAAVMKVADEEEAIRLANDSNYGLSAVCGPPTPRGPSASPSAWTPAASAPTTRWRRSSTSAAVRGWKQSGSGLASAAPGRS